MELKKLNQSQLAEASGVPQGQLSLYLSGERSPSIDTVFDLSIALGVTIDSLLGRVVSSSDKARNAAEDRQRIEAMRLVLSVQGDDIGLAVERLRKLSQPLDSSTSGKKAKPSAG
jgi:transcriptional regulator with XRE-family HTH domain